MADGFEAFHVPQQSRRDKLRVIGGGAAGSTQQQCHPLVQPSSATHPLPVCSGSLLPLYDPSFVTNSEFPSHHFHGEMVSATDEGCKGQSTGGSSKVEGGPNLMGFVGRTVHSGLSSSSSSISHHPYLDPDTSLPINPGLIQVFGSNPFLYTPQNLREFEQNYNGDEVMMYKPEPLSLSLSSQNTHNRYFPLEMNLQRYGSTMYGDKANDGGYGIPGKFVGTSTGSASNEVSRSFIPLGPFIGYASVLKQSRFLRPAQQLLEEFCYINGGNEINSEKLTADVSLMDPSPPADTLDSAGDVTEESLGGKDGGEARSKKSRLLTMLDEVYRKYKQYYQQMQAVVTSFECVAGLGNAAPYANLAVKAMTKHFRCLKNAISDQLQFTNNSNLLVSHGKDASPTFIGTKGDMYGQKPVHSAAGFLDHQSVWRPHRGLPERAVSVLRAWLFEHFLHPYPTDADKLMLAKQTGLSRNQVSNWFINARVRLWKPMVEEIHTLETRQAQKSSQKDDETAKRSADPLAPNSLVSDNPSTSADRVYDFPRKRNGNELPTDMPMRRQEPMNLPCNTLPSTQPLGVNVGMGSGSSVSLTLGLHHNHHQIGLSEPFPVSAAQRFGLTLEPNNETYVMGGFDSQNRHFGRDVMEGQLLHDFVR